MSWRLVGVSCKIRRNKHRRMTPGLLPRSCSWRSIGHIFEDAYYSRVDVALAWVYESSDISANMVASRFFDAALLLFLKAASCLLPRYR